MSRGSWDEAPPMTGPGGFGGFLDRALARGPLRPWPRAELDGDGWRALLQRLETTPDWSLIGLWAEPSRVHLTLRDDPNGDIAVFSLAAPEGRYPAVSPVRPGALRLERAIRDLFGLAAEGAEDERPWLDHGRWPVARPLAANPAPPSEPPGYAFLPAEGEGLHQIPVGPVHAGVIEPGHFRFHANGETVVRLEERLGYVHKGIEGLMAGKTPAEAARLAARISGDSTVAHSLGFARAVEAALGIEAPPRAHCLRALMAELERIANHVFDIGAICNDATFPLLLAELTRLREAVLQAAGECFGHRLMMDRVVPGGVAVDLGADGAQRIGALVRTLRPRFAELMRIYDSKPSLLDRMVQTGVTARALVERFAAGGHVGRAAGRAQDARRSPGYPPYPDLDFVVPVLTEGDVNARVLIRQREVEASLGLVEQILARLPAGPILESLPANGGACEGMALVEAFRGELMTWVALDAAGRVRRCHPRDASWFQWPLLEAAIEGNIVADFPLCNKSFNCSYSGQDL
jgi:Ni,Fe-hydrogenase III large subunit